MNHDPSRPGALPGSDAVPETAATRPAFSEKGFYLEEFRGRAMGLLLPDAEATAHPGLLSVLDELRVNHTRVILVAPAGAALEALTCEILPSDVERLEGRIWRALRRHERVVVAVAAASAREALFTTLLDLAHRLSLFKVIRLADIAGMHDAKGRRRSFVDRAELSALGASQPPATLALLHEIEHLLDAGVSNVNLCTLDGLHDELFTYPGSGTLFTRDRYTIVRALGVDDYDAAEDLIQRGTAEGYLAPRSEEEIDELLARSFGVFIGGRHLAGIGALRLYPAARTGEVASLYTLTRYVGAGLGGRLVGHALERARALRLDTVFACTTSPRVGDFFQQLGFSPVDADRLPGEKWAGYSTERRARLLCFQRALLGEG